MAELLESLMGVAFRTGAVRLRSSPREPALRHARTCYDHLAGERAVAVYEALLNAGILQKDELDALTLTASGANWLKSWGLDAAALAPHSRRPLCRTCVDWSERRHHLGGALGAALLARFSGTRLAAARCRLARGALHPAGRAGAHRVVAQRRRLGCAPQPFHTNGNFNCLKKPSDTQSPSTP